MPQLHPSVEALVGRVIAAGKPFDWSAEFGALVELDRLAREMDAPPARDLPALLDTPLMVGNVTLRRLSWAGIEWYNELVSAWRDDAPLRELALAWAHANSRDVAAMAAMLSAGRSAVRRKLRLWAWGLTAPWEAIQAAIDVLLPAMSPRASGGDPARRPPTSILAWLVGHTGLSADHWLYEVSYEQVCDVVREINEASFAEQARMASLLGKRLSDPDESWAFQSFLRFRNASKAFLDRHGVEHRRRKSAAGETA